MTALRCAAAALLVQSAAALRCAPRAACGPVVGALGWRAASAATMLTPEEEEFERRMAEFRAAGPPATLPPLEDGPDTPVEGAEAGEGGADEEEASWVDLSTPLGNDIDLSPIRGPPVPGEEEEEDDARPLYACLAEYLPGCAPSPALSQRYAAWLSRARSDGAALLPLHAV